MTARARLRDWIRRSKLIDKEAAREIGIDATDLSKYLKGTKVPGLANAVKIHDVTGIPPQAWVTSSEDPVASASDRSEDK